MDIPADIYETLGDTTIVLLTLTAPTFGAVHRIPKPGHKPVSCRCGKTHAAGVDDFLRGVPVDPLAYDYAGQVRWNYHLGRLWDRTRTNLRRNFPGAEYAVVREWQARGVLHLHVLLRLPTPHGVDLARIAEVASASSTSAHGSRYGWGSQIDARVIHRTGESTGATLRYLAKVMGYLHKSVADQWAPASRDHQRRLDIAARRMQCDACVPGSPFCRALAHRQWGARSSVVSVSRPTSSRTGWSLSGLTRGALRAQRRSWAAQSPEPSDSGRSAALLAFWANAADRAPARAVEELTALARRIQKRLTRSRVDRPAEAASPRPAQRVGIPAQPDAHFLTRLETPSRTTTSVRRT